MLENAASLVHVLSTASEVKGFLFLVFRKFDCVTSSVKKQLLVHLAKTKA